MKAADYPYPQPDSSQLVLGDLSVPLTGVQLKKPLAEWTVRHGEANMSVEEFGRGQYEEEIKARRCPVIAYGSNANPEVLRGKLAAAGRVFVPMLRAELRDFDIVYSAHVSPTGAIPATPAESPGTRLTVFVLLLDATQLSALHATEPNYVCMLLDDAAALTVDGDAPAQAYVYASKHGLLNVEGKPRALAAVPAVERTFPTLSEQQALDIAAERLAARPAAEPEAAKEQTALLKLDALPAELSFEPDENDLTVGKTTDAMRRAAEHNYVIAVSERRKDELNLGRYAVLSCDAWDRELRRRRLAVSGRVVTVEEDELGDFDIAADQTLRGAVGISYEAEGSGACRVGVHPIKGFRLGRRDRLLARWLGWRYLLMRVTRADVGDMEKQLARIPEDAFRLLGSTTGDRLRVESVRVKDGGYKLETQGVRAHALTEGILERREKTSEPFVNARHPDPEQTLGVEPDILPIYLDASARSDLGVKPLEAVAVRPDLFHLLAREVREVGFAFFLSAFAIYSLWESVLVVPLAALFALLVALLNIRARVGT